MKNLTSNELDRMKEYIQTSINLKKNPNNADPKDVDKLTRTVLRSVKEALLGVYLNSPSKGAHRSAEEAISYIDMILINRCLTIENLKEIENYLDTVRVQDLTEKI